MSGRSLQSEEPRALCVFCTEAPSGNRGHPGLAQGVDKLGSSERVYERVVCEFCGAEWVRNRKKAGVFAWLRVAD